MHKFTKIFTKDTSNFTGLFYSLVLILLIIPFFQGHIFAEEIFVSAFSIILISALYALRGNNKYFNQITIISAIALISNFAAYFTTYKFLDNLSLILNTTFFICAAGFMFRSVFYNQKVSLNTIMGAICVYIIIGMAWGMVYELLDTFVPQSFNIKDIALATSQMDSFVRNYMYYSLATISTLGSSTVVPFSTPALYLSALEAIFGQMYLTILVARLVGMHIAQKQ